MYPQSQSQSPKSDSQQPSGVAPFSKQSDIGRAAPRESGETDTGSVFRDPGSTSGGSTSFDNQQNDWIGSTGIAVDQVLQTHYESSDTYNEETVSAETWAEGSNFDLDFRRQQVSAQDNSILTLNEMNPDVASTGGSRRPSVSITSLNRQTSQGQTSQGSAGSEVDDSDELNNRLKSMGIGYGKTPTTSSAPSYSQRPSKPQTDTRDHGGGRFMAYPQLQPGQQYQQYQQPQQQHQQQYHPQQQQQQYVMIPGVGLTLVPVMHMPHHMGTPMSPNMSMQQHFMPPPMQNPYMQHMHAPHQQHNPYNQQGYAPVTARSAYKATASTLAAVALTSADGMVYLIHFKHAHRNFILSPASQRGIKVSEFVIVEADRGEDIGIVVEIVPAFTFSDDTHTAGHRGKGFATDQYGDIRKVLRIASADEIELLPGKAAEEAAVAEVCREKVLYQFQLPISVVDTEYQLDRHKLTVYYESQKRVDFRDLVRDLFALYKTRIWMAQVDSSFEPNLDASMALLTGQYIAGASESTSSLKSDPSRAAPIPLSSTSSDDYLTRQFNNQKGGGGSGGGF